VKNKILINKFLLKESRLYLNALVYLPNLRLVNDTAPNAEVKDEWWVVRKLEGNDHNLF
jgi:hypothetical protein